MSLHYAKKLVIITERIISDKVCAIIEDCGATGYTIVAAGGKGSRNIRSTAETASVISDFANVKIETIVNNHSMAEDIMEKVASQYFQNFPGVTYLENVEILRPYKFIAIDDDEE